jgi:HlyD family secretion protein
MKTRPRAILWWPVLAALAVTVLLFGLRPQPVPVDVARVVRGHFEDTVAEDGKTRVRERYTVSAPLEGTLERIRLKAGDPVERNMVLAIIHPKQPLLLDTRTEQELSARLRAAEATRQQALAAAERARASMTQAKADYARTKALADAGLAPPAHRERDELTLKLASKDLIAAEFAADVATHQVEMAQAALSRGRDVTKATSLDQRWEIRSPVLGRVLRVLQENEAAVTPGTPLLELADPMELEVIVDVLTTDALQVHPGAVVWLERWGGDAPVQGRVRLVEPSGFTKISALGVEEQRVNVVIDLIDPPAQWNNVGDGYRVDARIVVFRQDDAVTVPTGALFREGDQWAVFVVTDGYARKRRIQMVRRNGNEALVEGGLEPGEEVIVYPSDAAADGARVVVRHVDERKIQN